MRHGSNLDPPNPFESVRNEPDPDHWEWDLEHQRSLNHRKIEYLQDDSQTIVSENRSPDIPFRYSINPYRGCIHGCSYCYARPGHEYLGMNAGLDFETKIVVKYQAPALFRKFLGRKSWVPEAITFSGVTDCYQPAERKFRLTRQCLEVALECNQPVGLVTKNALVLRDIDLLTQMASKRLVHVYLSITSLDAELARDMEPRTSIPAARLRAVRELSEAKVPVGVMVSPIVPGLNDSELPQVLEAARQAGAISANYILLRLPSTVKPVFLEWLQRVRPNQAEKVIGRLQQTRGGEMNDSNWGSRMVGQGELAEQISKLFHVFKKQYGLDQSLPAYDFTQFVRPESQAGQMRLF